MSSRTLESLAAAVRGARHSLRAAYSQPLDQLCDWLLQAVYARQILARAGRIELFAPVSRIPIPASVECVLARWLDVPVLAEAFDDDTALGWAYQFWNDVDREAIDQRVGPRGKVARHEIASKTQLFTERYMVEWLVQNSLGRVWLAMRKARGATGDSCVLHWPWLVLDEGAPSRPLESPIGERLPADAEGLRVLDPACGTGHFLLGAFDALLELHAEQSRERGRTWDPVQAVFCILHENLRGVDIDPRAVELARAALRLRAWCAAGVLVTAEGVLASVPPAESPPPREAPWCDASWLGSLLRFAPDTPSAASALLPWQSQLRACLRDGAYDVVLANPPYLARAKIEGAEVGLEGVADLFEAFFLRARQLCKPHGVMAFVTLSNWMFLHSFAALRRELLRGHMHLLVDLGKGAFGQASKLIQTAMIVASPAPEHAPSLGIRVGSIHHADGEQVARIAEALRDHPRPFPFDASLFEALPGSPLLFWLPAAFLNAYRAAPKLGEVARGAGGIATTHNQRFVRAHWELQRTAYRPDVPDAEWLPYLKGADGREWIEPPRWLLRAAELRTTQPAVRVQPDRDLGVAYTTIGTRFAARLHRVRSVRDVSGASLFAETATPAELLCAMNRTSNRELAAALNPTVNFQLNDVRRLPFVRVEASETIVDTLRVAFDEAEAGDERSVAYVAPRPQRWAAAQRWAQRAVDRDPGAALPAFDAAYEPVPAWQWLSHALGVALGRFAGAAAGTTSTEGLLLVSALGHDSLSDPACALLHQRWSEHGASLGVDSLQRWLRLEFFDLHRRHYDARPIYFPLSSARRNFVLWMSVHRWHGGTMAVALETILRPALRAAQRRSAPRDAEMVQELASFVAAFQTVCEQGPPSPDAPDARTPAREVDAPYAMHLDDGVLINAAPLWPLLAPQWPEPKRCWREIARAQGRKSPSWCMQSTRYFPSRSRSD